MKVRGVDEAFVLVWVASFRDGAAISLGDPMFLSTILAYVDPVSGAIIIQLLFAGAVGCVAFFRRSILGGLRILFGRRGDEGKKAEETTQTRADTEDR